jgi:tetratricopeptide (TPR) repeat protein
MPKFIFLTFILLVFSFRNVAQPNQNESIQSLEKELAIANDAHRADLLCKLALLYVYKPGEVAGDLDSALLLIGQAEIINSVSKDKATEANIYFIRSNALREKGDTASGHKAIDRSLKIYSAISVAPGYGDAYIELSRYYNVTSKEGCLKKKECYEKALVQFQSAGLKEKQADALKDLGDFNQLLRNYGLAMIDLRQALAIYTSIGYKNLQGIYDLLGIVSTDMGDFKQCDTIRVARSGDC